MAMLVAGCGTRNRADDDTATNTLAMAPPTSFATVVTPPVATVASNAEISTITSAAEADEPARRNTVEIAWIAGSDSVWNDVDLPASVAQRISSTPAWNLEVTATIRIAPVAPDITTSIAEAVAAGADALVVPMNISWLTWKDPACLEMDIAQPYARYQCILSSLSPEIDEANATSLQTMIDAVVASGLPTLMYAIPHSTDVLNDQRLGPIIDAAEQRLVMFDPHDPNVAFFAESFTRDLPPFVEGVDFIDMVHPTPTGAERLADWLATRVIDVVVAAQR